MKPWVSFIILMSLFPLAACRSAPEKDAPVASGIEGKVLKGPLCPGPSRPGHPCPDKPFSAAFRVLNAYGVEVARFTSDQEGRFRILVPPDEYFIVPDPLTTEWAGVRSTAVRKKITVEKGKISVVEWHFDTGMR